MFVIRGRVTRDSDPLHTDSDDRRDVRKLVLTRDDLVNTALRWTELGRMIYSVVESDRCQLCDCSFSESEKSTFCPDCEVLLEDASCSS